MNLHIVTFIPVPTGFNYLKQNMYRDSHICMRDCFARDPRFGQEVHYVSILGSAFWPLKWNVQICICFYHVTFPNNPHHIWGLNKIAGEFLILSLFRWTWSVLPGTVPQLFDPILNPLNAELNPICHLLALLGAHHILHVSKIGVKYVAARIAANVCVIKTYFLTDPRVLFPDSGLHWNVPCNFVV